MRDPKTSKEEKSQVVRTSNGMSKKTTKNKEKKAETPSSLFLIL